MSLYESGIRPSIDEYLLKKAEEERDYGEYWSGSSAGFCMRRQFFDRLGVDQVTPDPRKQRVFTSGHIFHQWLQGITKDAGLAIASEDELKDETLKVIGHFDDLVKLDHLILYEYKTVHSQSFKYKKENQPSHYHQMQVATYMYILRKKYKDLKEGRILLISKDDLRLMEQQIMYTPVLERKVIEYWNTLNSYWRDKKLPRCTCAEFDKNDRTGIGFMADKRYNPYYYNNEPCSYEWYLQWKTKQTA